MKRILLYLVAGLAPLFSPLSAHADGCERFFQRWGQQLHPGREIMATDPPREPPDYPYGYAVCKVWPANEALTLAVLPFPRAGSDHNEATFDLEVLVADTASGKIITHRFEKLAITSDAVRFSDLVLDTARYQLAPDKRAFGVKVTYVGLSNADPFESIVLNLYVIDRQRIRKVLGPLAVRDSTGEWDTNCDGHFTDITRTLDVGPIGKSGYAALKVTEQTVNSVSTAKGDQCIGKDTHHKRLIILKYRNGQYMVPRKMQFSNNLSFKR